MRFKDVSRRMKMKLAVAIILSITVSAFIVIGLAQSTTKRTGQGATRDFASESMGREARRRADDFWRGLIKCGKSYFLYSDVRLFEFRDTPHFTFGGEALKPRPLTRVDRLNGVDPLPVEWEGGTKVSFELCRMNTSHSELPGAYGYGRTLWDGWSAWSSQGCEFGTGISRAKGKWSVSALNKISCDDLATWGFIPKVTSRKPFSSPTGPTRTDYDSRYASYMVVSMTTGEKDGTPVMTQITNQAMDVVSKRLYLAGIIPNQVQLEQSGHSLVVMVPPLSNPDQIKKLITTTGRLEILSIVGRANPSEVERTYSPGEARTVVDGSNSRQFRVLPYASNLGVIQAGIPREPSWVIGELPEIVGVKGWKGCVVGSRNASAISELTCSLNSEGANAFAQWTHANVGRRFGLVLDGSVIAQYLVKGEMASSLQIKMRSNAAENFAIISKSGPLPVPIVIETQGTLSTYRVER
jgi:hypothetical protein